MPLCGELTTACLVIMFCEALALHVPMLRSRGADHGAATPHVLSTGVFYSGADYFQAQRVRRLGNGRLRALFEDVDLVVTPTTTAPAPTFEQLTAMVENATGADVGTVHTQYSDVTGHPVLSIPVGYNADGLPLGVQIAGRPFDVALVLRAGDACQRTTDWHLRIPPC